MQCGNCQKLPGCDRVLQKYLRKGKNTGKNPGGMEKLLSSDISGI